MALHGYLLLLIRSQHHYSVLLSIGMEKGKGLGMWLGRRALAQH